MMTRDSAPNGCLRGLSLALGLCLFAAAPCGFAASGGPDVGGYFWADSNEPGVDNSAYTFDSFTLVSPSPTDEQVVTLNYPAGFSFPFYGTNYTRFLVSSNGWVSFDTTATNPTPVNQANNDAAAPNTLIAFFWDDITTPLSLLHGPIQLGAGYQFQLTGYQKSTNQRIDAWLIVWKNGIFKLRWGMAADKATASIGTQNPAGVGTQLLFDGAATAGFALVSPPPYAVAFFPPGKLGCASAQPITCGGTVNVSSVSPPPLASNAVYYNCDANAYNGNEKLFTFNTTDTRNIDLLLSNFGARNMSVFLLRGCSELFGCLAGGAPAVSRLFAPPGTYYIVVDGLTAADDGTFDLRMTCDSPTSPIACGQRLTGQSTLAVDTVTNWPCAGAAQSGGEKFYQLNLPAAGHIQARLSNAPAGLSAIITDSTFTPTSPVCSDIGSPEAKVFDVPAGTYYVIVDGTAPGAANFDIDVACGKQLDCSAVADIACGDTVSGSTVGKPNRVSRYACDTDMYTGGEDVYRFVLTTPQLMGIGLDSTNPDLRYLLLRECDESACFIDAEVLRCERPLDAGTYYVVVDGLNGASGTYDLTVACVNTPPAGFMRWWNSELCGETPPPTHNCDPEATTEATDWHFDSGRYCGTGNNFAMYVTVECGNFFYIPFVDVESGHIKIWDEFNARYMDLFAENDLPPGDPYHWEMNGQDIQWVSQGCPDNNAAGGDRRFNDRIISVLFQGSPTVCGIYRLEFYNWGGWDWHLYANCTGDNAAGYLIYDNLCQATAEWEPRPEFSLSNPRIVTQNCPFSVEVAFDATNVGCLAGDVPVQINSSAGDPELQVVGTGIVPGETRTITATYVTTTVPATLSVDSDKYNVVAECHEGGGSTVACNVPNGSQTLYIDACPDSCETRAEAGADRSICQGDSTQLDGVASFIKNCMAGVIEYRWLDQALNEIRGWSTDPVFSVQPGTTTSYTLQVRCSSMPSVCVTADTVFIEVVPDAVPQDVGNTLRGLRNVSDIAFGWANAQSSTNPAVKYRLMRDSQKQFTSPILMVETDSSRTSAVLRSAIAEPPDIAFYRVRGVSCGGIEGP